MTAFTPVYAESTDTEDTAAVDWENGENIKAIKEKGVITVATGTYVPFEYRDDDDNIVGFDIDLAQYIADKLGVDMEVTDMEFQSIVPSIQNGEYDFSIAAMYKTERKMRGCGYVQILLRQWYDPCRERRFRVCRYR